MIVKELIEKLKELDGDREIYFQDLESGYSVRINKIEENCLFKFKVGYDGRDFKRGTIFSGEGFNSYEREKEKSDGIVEYKDTYIIK